MKEDSASIHQKAFAEMMLGPDEDVDLAKAALHIAAEEFPDLDIGRYLRNLDALGEGAQEYAAKERELGPKIALLSEYLYSDQGFQGNRHDYYDPDNSYLNRVLDRRTGIPILLSLVHMEVGRSLGLVFEGIGLPGHFVIRVGPPEQEAYVDPFEGGTVLSRSDCEHRIQSMFGGSVEVGDVHFASYTRKQFLGRILNNLKHIYRSKGEHHKAIMMASFAHMTAPDWGENLKERAWLHHAVGEYRRAIADLESYLKISPEAKDAENIKKQIQGIWSALARSN